MYRKWTKELCISELDRYIKKHNAASGSKNTISSKTLADPGTFKKHVGQSYYDYIKMTYPEHAKNYKKRGSWQNNWTEQDCIRSIEKFILSNGHIPTNDEMMSHTDIPSPLQFKTVIGRTLNEYAKENWPLFVVHSMPSEQWTESSIKDAVRAFVEKNNRLPKTTECTFKNGLPSRNTFMNVLGISMTEFLGIEYAGFKNGETARLTEDGIKEAVDRFIAGNKRYPFVRDFLRRNNLPTINEVKSVTGMTPSYFLAKHYKVAMREPKWTKERIKEAVDAYVNANKRFPWLSEYKGSNGLPNNMTVTRVMGKSMSELYKEWYPDLFAGYSQRKNLWTKEKLDGAIDRFVSENNKIPSSNDFNTRPELPNYSTAKKIIGAIPFKYCSDRFPGLRVERTNSLRWTKESIDDIIDRFVAEHGRIPKHSEFISGNGFPSHTTLERHMGTSFVKYCRQRHPEIETAYNKKNKWSKDEVEKAINRFIAKHGRIPRYDELNNTNDLPSYPITRRALSKPPNEYYKERYPELLSINYSTVNKNPKWTEEKINEAFDKFVATHNRVPLACEIHSSNGFPCYNNFKTVMGCTPVMYCKNRYGGLLDDNQAENEIETEDNTFDIEDEGMVLSM